MPFVKGDPNINRNGRPKGSVSVVDAIRKKLKEHVKGQEDMLPSEKKTYLDKLVESYLDKGINKQSDKILVDVIDRIDGRSQESIDITSEGNRIGMPDTIIEIHKISEIKEAEIKELKEGDDERNTTAPGSGSSSESQAEASL